jgi:hypothetical protein
MNWRGECAGSVSSIARDLFNGCLQSINIQVDINNNTCLLLSL